MRGGFTVVEIIIVVVIVAILSTLTFAMMDIVSQYQFDGRVGSIMDFIGDTKFAIPKNQSESVSIFASASTGSAKNAYIAAYSDRERTSCGINPAALYATGYSVTGAVQSGSVIPTSATFASDYSGYTIFAQSHDANGNISQPAALSGEDRSHSVTGSSLYTYTFIAPGQTTPCGELSVRMLTDPSDASGAWNLSVSSITAHAYGVDTPVSSIQATFARSLSRPRIYDMDTGNLSQAATIVVQDTAGDTREMVLP